MRGFPEPGRACNGFLLEVENFAVLLDLGYGALRHLLTARPAGDVDAIVVTHEHPDHCVDLHALARVMVYGQRFSGRGERAPVPLFCPTGVLDRLAGIEPDLDLRRVFDHRPVRNLMTATEAGHWAQEADARRLLLTHFWPGTDRVRAVADAEGAFAGEVLAADEGLSLPL